MAVYRCRRSCRYFAGVILLAFFLCASLINITKLFDIHVPNVLKVSQFTRFESHVSKPTESPEHRLDPTKPKIVIILAYMHTGSSYTAELIHQHPGSFYEFEPLRSIQMSARIERPLVYLNGTQRQYNRSFNDATDTGRAAWLVHSVATCNHGQLDAGTLSNFFFGIGNGMYRDYVPYIKCVANGQSALVRPHSKLLAQSYINITNVKTCVPLMEEACGNATIRLSKYIRLTMDAVLQVVNKVDNVRVIHLVRDPRAMMDSQLRKNDMNVASFPVFVERTREMCSRMKRDLKLADVIKKEIPNVLRTWRYEDFVDHPMSTAEELFEFIEEDFNPVFENYVRNKSIKSTKNSTVRQAIWRSHISLRHLQAVDQHCSFLYDQLGYIPLSSIEEVRNLTKKDYI